MHSSGLLQSCGVHDSVHVYPLCGIFYLPWHIGNIKKKCGKRNCQSSEAAPPGFEHNTTRSSVAVASMVVVGLRFIELLSVLVFGCVYVDTYVVDDPTNLGVSTQLC